MNAAIALRSVAEEIAENNRDRKPKLVELKLRRMAQDPFAFFRGTDHLFANQWPRLAPPDVGPSVLICGDLHLENFGAYRAGDGTFLYDINDFDEALVAPCSLDLVRCATSILLGAQIWKHTPMQALRTLLTSSPKRTAPAWTGSGNNRGGSAAPSRSRAGSRPGPTSAEAAWTEASDPALLLGGRRAPGSIRSSPRRSATPTGPVAITRRSVSPSTRGIARRSDP
jgi:hypothetical protein